MKRMVNYAVNATAITIATVLMLTGDAMLVIAGLCMFVLMYVSGELWPDWWKTFWVTNIRILSAFNCL